MDRSRAASKLRKIQRKETSDILSDDHRTLSTPLLNDGDGSAAGGSQPPRSVTSDVSRWLGGTGSQMSSRSQRDTVKRMQSNVNGQMEAGRQQSADDAEDTDDYEVPGFFSPVSDLVAMRDMITSSYVNILLVFVPLGFIVQYTQMNAVTIFFTNFMGLVPLALLLGDCTEDLAVRFGDVIGGLLNATFGNVVEMILSIAALQKDLFYVVATSLMGSVLSNLLLVLGCCFFFGGMFYKTQRFNTVLGKSGNSLLMLVCIGIVMPTLLKSINPEAETVILPLSRCIALLLAFVYLIYLYFQLFSHSDVISEKYKGDDDDDEDDEEEVPSLSISGGFALLGLITVVVAFMSEYLTGSIEEVSQQVPWLNQGFLGMIVLPIAGNACEHITAVLVAMKNKMDLSIGVAVGSSVQIALFVIPFMVLTAWGMGKDFSLEFDLFAVIMLTLSVILTSFVTYDGESNYLLGVQLICVYLLLTIAYLLGAAK